MWRLIADYVSWFIIGAAVVWLLLSCGCGGVADSTALDPVDPAPDRWVVVIRCLDGQHRVTCPTYEQCIEIATDSVAGGCASATVGAVDATD